MDYRAELILLVETFCGHVSRSEARIANRAGRDGRFFARIREGKTCSVDTLHLVRRWFSDNWPIDLEWPAGIERASPPHWNGGPDELWRLSSPRLAAPSGAETPPPSLAATPEAGSAPRCWLFAVDQRQLEELEGAAVPVAAVEVTILNRAGAGLRVNSHGVFTVPARATSQSPSPEGAA